MKKTILLVLMLMMFCLGVMAYSGKSVTLTQYNGDKIEAYLVEDNGFTYYEDKDGYIIVKKDDTYYYGTFDSNEIVITENIVGECDPIFLGLNKYEKSKGVIPGLEKTSFELLKASVGNVKVPNGGNVKPIVILCGKRRDNDSPELLPGDIYANYDEYWDNTNKLIKTGEKCYNEEGTFYRQSIDETIRVGERNNDDLYISDTAATIETYKDRILEQMGEDDESIYDINGDGYVDAVIIVSTYISASSKGRSVDVSSSGIYLGNLKVGMVYETNPEYFREAKYFSSLISDMLGFDSVKPYGKQVYANLFTPKYGDTAVADETKTYISNGKYIPNISTMLNFMSRGKVAFSGSYLNRDADWALEDVELAGFSASNIQTMLDAATFYGMTTDTDILDINEDGYVDLIILVTASGNLTFNDYSNSFIKYKDTGLFVGKVLIIPEGQFANGSIDAATQIVKGLNYRSLLRDADDYKPGYMLDYFGNLGDYDFVVPSVYAQRQAGYIITDEEAEEEAKEEEELNSFDGFESTGIKTITKEDSLGEVAIYKIFPSVSEPSEKQTIAYKILSEYNENEEFWVEYRKPIKEIDDIILNKEPDSGLYVYRVNKNVLARGNKGAGQTGDYYIPDEIYYFREGGTPDYGYSDSEALTNMNGDPTTANIGVVGRKTFDYQSDPRAFFSNDLVEADFQIYDVTFDKKEKYATFKVRYGLSSPKVDGVTPIGVNVEADSSVFKEFRASYSYDVGAINLNNLGFYWGSNATYSSDSASETYENYLTLTYNNYLNQVTMKSCKLIVDEGEEEERTFTDHTYKFGESKENGNDIIIYNDRFKLNVTKSYAKYIDNKLVLFYYIAPTDEFIEKIDNTTIVDPYTDGEKIYVHQSANAVDGKKAVDKFNNDIISIGLFGWTLKTSKITFDSLEPESIINVDNHDYFLENVTAKATYDIEEEEPTEEEPEPLLPKEYINHHGVIYQNYKSSSALLFDYMPNILNDYEGEYKFTYDEYNIKVKYKINNISGFLGGYTTDITAGVTNPVLAITNIDFEILECDPETIEAFIFTVDVKEYLEEQIAENPGKLFDMIKGHIPYENVIDWHDTDNLQNADPMVIGNGFVTVEASTFNVDNSQGNKSIQYSFSPNFDKDKMKDTFGINLEETQVYFSEYGFASLQEDLEDVFNDIQKKRIGKKTDYKYIGYIGIGGNDTQVQPVINSVVITPEPESNPFITSKILPFDENVSITVNYSPAKIGEKVIDTSDVLFRFVKPSGEDAIVIRFNPVTKIFYTYNSNTKEWKKSNFDEELNISVGNFTIPCKLYNSQVVNEDGSYDFTFYIRSSARFADAPLTLESIVTDERGYSSDTFYGDTTYIFRKASSNVVPTIESISPCKGSIKANTATDFVITASDQDSYFDINNIILNLNCGLVNELYARYNFQENTIQILKEDGTLYEEVILGSNTDDLICNNFSLDVRNSYYKVINSDKIELHLSITPLSALSGNSVKIKGYVDDIYWTDQKTDDYVTKTYGYITIETVDPDEIILNKTSIKIGTNESCKLKVINSKGEEVKAIWTSKNKSIASVSNGKVVGVKAGSTIVVANVNGKTLKCSVSVSNPSVKAGSNTGEVVDNTISNDTVSNSPSTNKTGLSNINGLADATQKVIKNNK